MSHKKETRLAQLSTKKGLKLLDKRKQSQLKSNKSEDEKMTEIKKKEPIDSKFKKMKTLKLAFESS